MNGAWKTTALTALLLASTQVSCVTQKREGEQIVPEHLYELTASYSHEERAFLLALTSHADSEICVPTMRWADERGGHYFYEDRRVYFLDRGIRYDIKDLPSGFCTPHQGEGCVYILRKDDRLHGKLPIDDFVVPSAIVQSRDFNPRFNYPYDLRFCTN